MYLKITKIIGISIAGCLVWNSLLLGAYHWQKALREWSKSEWVQNVDYGHAPEELALNMDTDLLKQMEKAVANELKFRKNK